MSREYLWVSLRRFCGYGSLPTQIHENRIVENPPLDHDHEEDCGRWQPIRGRRTCDSENHIHLEANLKTRDIDRLDFLLLVCSTSLWCTAVIAVRAKEKAQVIKLWPKDAASQGTQGMGPQARSWRWTYTPHQHYDAFVTLFPRSRSRTTPRAVILCPGGGYVSLVTTKMTPVAHWLNGHGISAFILIYRAPKKRQDAFQDVQRAVRMVRSRASEWNLDPERIGIMGSSAEDTSLPGSVLVLEFKPIRKSMSLTVSAANPISRSCSTRPT